MTRYCWICHDVAKRSTGDSRDWELDGWLRRPDQLYRSCLLSRRRAPSRTDFLRSLVYFCTFGLRKGSCRRIRVLPRDIRIYWRILPHSTLSSGPQLPNTAIGHHWPESIIIMWGIGGVYGHGLSYVSMVFYGIQGFQWSRWLLLWLSGGQVVA